jgi:hypothetical protein
LYAKEEVLTPIYRKKKIKLFCWKIIKLPLGLRVNTSMLPDGGVEDLA